MLLVVLGVLLSGFDAFKVQGLKIQDWQRRLITTSANASDKVVLIEVDQYSLDRMQEEQGIGWPWPRELYGGISQYAANGGANAVVIDILFNNETPCAVASDNQFAELMQSSGIAYLGTAFSRKGEQALTDIGHNYEGQPPESVIRRSASLPLPVLLTAARGIGNVSDYPDVDGTFRRITPAIDISGKAVASLSLAPFMQDVQVSWKESDLYIGDQKLPLDEEARLWVNYRGGEVPYRQFSAYDVIQSYIAIQSGEAPVISPGEFKGANVVVGYVAPGLYDLKPTPFSSSAPGMDVHAAVMDNWLTGDFLYPLASWQSSVIGILFALAIFFIHLRDEAAKIVIGTATGTFIIFIGIGFVLLRYGVIADTARMLLPAVIIFAISGAQRLIQESRQKEYRQKSLERMVSPGVAEWLLAEPERLGRIGETRPITVFFSDLANFTTISEKLGPSRTVDLLNDYLEYMQKDIIKEDGTLNKFIGDAVMAFWGAPKIQEDQTYRAVRTALAIQNTLADFGDEYDLGQPLVTRIGIDHGDCLVGNIGSADRFEYTAIGDTVNQASRLEGLNKFYGTRIMLSESAWHATEGAFFGRMLDLVQVKGKTHPVAVYQPLCSKGEETEDQISLCKYYEEAWQHYRNQRWEEATELLTKQEILLEDPPSIGLLDRVRHFTQDSAAAPGPDWDGVWRYTTK
ncbi:MAG: adenylate/guanylate cyclase domain-containing protein [Gammaproteobacteria bacterium]|nr:MAG: adenylate/guanylate cyclase domain-containing protein [Gammaproteobacteria bacterium]